MSGKECTIVTVTSNNGFYQEVFKTRAFVGEGHRASAEAWAAKFKAAGHFVAFHASELEEVEEEDEIAKFPEACPGCGCMPGDGRTPGCTDPLGCGFDHGVAS